MEQAKCAGLAPNKRVSPEDQDPWFPEKGQSPNLGKMYCAVCPVRAECKEYRDRTDSRHGMWGGEIQPRKKKEA